MKKVYLVEWQDLVDRYIKIEASSEDEAKDIWNSSEFNYNDIQDSDCQLYDDVKVTEDE